MDFSFGSLIPGAERKKKRFLMKTGGKNQ